MSLAKEFKEFAMKGNVIDMAVGVIIGAAFGKIIASLVEDVIMPPLGKVIGGVNFTDLAVSLGMGRGRQDRSAVEVRQLPADRLPVPDRRPGAVHGDSHASTSSRSRIRRAPAPTAPRQEVLLTEIRDLLAKK